MVLVPGPLAVFHRIFIVTAIVGSLVYALWELGEYGRSGQGAAMACAVLGFVGSVALGLYLWSIRRGVARPMPREESRRGG